jgi:hypothetical protein
VTPAERLPIPLAVAAILAAAEGVVLFVYGLVLIPTLSSERVAMGSTSVAFFVLYGLFLTFAAFKLARRHSWARAPIMLAQLIQIAVGLTWGNPLVAVVLAVPAVVTAGAMLFPTSVRALAER